MVNIEIIWCIENSLTKNLPTPQFLWSILSKILFINTIVHINFSHNKLSRKY